MIMRDVKAPDADRTADAPQDPTASDVPYPLLAMTGILGHLDTH